jgi:hypothetical protein
MLSHALTLNAQEVKQNLTIANYPNLPASDKKGVLKIYDKIIDGEETASRDKIESDRKRLKSILYSNKRIVNGSNKRHS